MGNKINVNINNLFSESANAGVSIAEVAHDYKKVTGKCVVGAKIDNMLVDFDTKLYENVSVEFFDYTDKVGNKMYQSGLKFLLIIAARELWNREVYFKYSIDKGIYVEVEGKRLSDDDLLELKIKMEEIVSYDFPIRKRVTKNRDAITYYLASGNDEKASNILHLPGGYVELYEIDHTFNYFYSNMPASTGELGLFNLERIEKNALVLLYPRPETGILPEYSHNEKIYEELVKNNKWSKKMGISYVDSLNALVSQGKIQKFIKMNNIFINDALYIIAKDIVKKSKDVKFILIGGPSSSGKTTSAHRLCTYLETFGVKPIVISADDYFKDRKDSPKDKFGNYDFESLDSLDLDLFNEQMNKLLKGEAVSMPTFNFMTGEKEYNNAPTVLKEDNVLLIEGLHCLNDEMTKKIKRVNKYKIFVCPFTPLGLDRHNHLSTTDMRIIRRIVRDNRVRGNNVEMTLKGWGKVKAGEDKYIFPYTFDADAVLNTAYAYEVGVLRVYAEPLLYSVPMHSPYYEEARRLLGLLRAFYPISSEYIEDDNTLREFIGGSIYEK